MMPEMKVGKKGRRGVRSIRPHETEICVYEGAVSTRCIGITKSSDENIIAAVGMKTGRG